MSFDVTKGDAFAGHFSIPIPGTFNVQNTLGAIIVAKELAIADDLIQRGLSSFKSVKRRLELRGEVNGVRVYDDFAHHPTAVQETLRAVRERNPGARIWAVFEPRSQTCRRRVFEQAFIESFDPADFTVIARVFGASHLEPEQTLSPDRVAEGIRARGGNASTFRSTDEIVASHPELRRAIMSSSCQWRIHNIHNKLLERLRGGSNEDGAASVLDRLR
jgi:UDP-N-acetylmuramate: L-alanyl-gamma-D-glutamyl-meso-diaminopimelate ligase